MGCATSAISKEPLSSSDDRREPGDRRQFDVVVGGEDADLVAVGFAVAHFAQPEAVGQAGAAFGQGHDYAFAVVEGDGAGRELGLGPVGGGELMVGEDGHTEGFELGKERGRVAFAIKDDGQARGRRHGGERSGLWSRGGSDGGFGMIKGDGVNGSGGGHRIHRDEGEQAGDDLFAQNGAKAGVDRVGDHEEGLAAKAVDPVVGGAGRAGRTFFGARGGR
ncbi:MAG: hypothetical protein H2172_11005 [Opitutus sp.]|nr:hypothetical protein [Opitutus sp.]MCS6247970.1 hypothetical protein [Opitutus sp.]MCS6275363.1 hypothetical protein [Opitutus sp.]MCS6276878.1 hypothetical protein [Opitutus sp.]MCS6301473.1 hypothetical protein [Opitutus sp.]